MRFKFFAIHNRHPHALPLSSFYRLFCFRATLVLELGLLLSALIACSSGTAQQATPTQFSASPTPTSIPANTVLFQSDWSKGLDAWKTTSGWKVKNGSIESDLSDKLSLTLPYQPTVANYAVEYRLQVVSVPKDGGQFQLVADQQATGDGYSADVLGLLTPGPHPHYIHPLAEMLIEPGDSMESDPQLLDYEPTADWHVYRVEVQGRRASFLVDGRAISRASSTRTDSLSRGPIHLLSHGAILRVSSIRVLTL